MYIRLALSPPTTSSLFLLHFFLYLISESNISCTGCIGCAMVFKRQASDIIYVHCHMRNILSVTLSPTTLTHSLAHSPSFKYSASSFLSMGTTPLIYSYYGFEAVLLFTCGVVIVSAIAAVLLVGIDRTYEEYLSGDSESESFEWGNMLHLGPVFWMLVVATCAFYFSVLPFISFSNEFLIDKWQVSEEEAGIMTGT